MFVFILYYYLCFSKGTDKKALGIGLGIGLGVPVLIGIIALIVILSRRKYRYLILKSRTSVTKCMFIGIKCMYIRMLNTF